MTSSSQPAPSYQVPARSVVSVEHPYIVKNVSKGIEMLGGPDAITEMIRDPNYRTLNLNFHPEDPATRGVISNNPSTNNVLLKITVPRRTGRKRKRGSDLPFQEDNNSNPQKQDAQRLLRSLTDNPDSYTVEPLGKVEITNVFRAMPDFVYSLQGSEFIDNLRSTAMTNEYPSIRKFKLPQTYGLTNTETYPPPVLSNSTYTNNYSYRQNPAVKQVIDQTTGSKSLHNTQAPLKIYTHQCHWDQPTYPSTVPDDITPLHEQPINLQNLVSVIRHLFHKRPIWTRRALINHIPPHMPVFLVRYALAYLTYAIRSGPWRDSYCLLGLDPRTHPQYRKYQTMLLQLVSNTNTNPSLSTPHKPNHPNSDPDFHRTWKRGSDTQSHIFTGTSPIPEDGKVWQFCDILDPQLKSLIDLPDLYLRSRCELRYFGWYANGTISKLRVLLKTKVDRLVATAGLYPEDPAIFSAFLQLPESWDGPVRDPATGKVIEDPTRGYLAKDGGHSKRELEWATAYRAMCRSLPGEVPAPGRLSKRNPKVRKSLLDEGDEGVRGRIMGTAENKENEKTPTDAGGGGSAEEERTQGVEDNADAEGEADEEDDTALAARYEGPEEGVGDDEELGLDDDNDEEGLGLEGHDRGNGEGRDGGGGDEEMDDEAEA